MSRRAEPNRGGIMATLARFGRGRAAPPAGDHGRTYLPPSRKNRRSITTWQDEVVLKRLRDISHETGISQQTLIAEALNDLLAKYER